MSFITAQELKARLASSPRGAYLFFGEEEHLKRVYLSRFRALVTENPEFNVTVLDLKEGDVVSQIRAETDRLPFLSDVRFLEVRSLLPHRLTDREAEELLALLSAVPEDLILIFYFFECDVPFSGNIPRTQKKLKDTLFFKRLPENVTVVNFTHPTQAQLFAYYDSKFRSRFVRAEKRIVELFCSRGAGDMTLLENESEKLIALASATGGVLTEQMVDEALPALTETMVYKLSDAIESCNARAALSEYNTLRNMKFEPIPLLASIARALSNLALVRGGISEGEAEKTFGLKPFRTKTLRARAQKMRAEDIEQCLLLCSEADQKLKNTSLDEDVLLQALLVSVCRILGGDRA